MRKISAWLKVVVEGTEKRQILEIPLRQTLQDLEIDVMGDKNVSEVWGRGTWLCGTKLAGGHAGVGINKEEEGLRYVGNDV